MKKLSFPFHKNKKSSAAGTGRFKRPHFWNMIGDDLFVDWAVIFSLSVFIATVLIVVGFSVYASGAASLASEPPILPTADSAAHFDAAELSRITAAFDSRAAERLLFGHGYAGPSDPSLP